jgi:methionyl-tRNA synthetase
MENNCRYAGHRYISITANYTDEWRQWWLNPDNVELFQFMAKDNVTFHGVIFPGSLMATRSNWTMVKMIAAIGAYR